MIHPDLDAPLGAKTSTPPFDDDAWDDLLNYIEEKRVIPIVGPELLRVETDTGPRLLFDWLAEKLAVRLNVDIRELPQPCTLNDVVCWFLAARGRREEAYTRLRSILRETNFAPPIALRQLAQITDFDLFVTTTFDPLLEQALNAELWAEKRFRDAAVLCAAHAERFPDSSEAHRLLATASLRAGDPAAARVHARKALELDPKNTAAKRALEELSSAK